MDKAEKEKFLELTSPPALVTEINIIKRPDTSLKQKHYSSITAEMYKFIFRQVILHTINIYCLVPVL